MAVKLHRCRSLWVKGPHPCWRVQKALDEAGVPYELVRHPVRRSRREEVAALTGQRALPVIELGDGRIVRGESSDLAARARGGEFGESAGGPTA